MKSFTIYKIKRGIKMNQLRKLRKEMNLSQSQLAEKIGVSRQTVSQIENNKLNPSLKICLSIAKILHTDLNTLFWK